MYLLVVAPTALARLHRHVVLLDDGGTSTPRDVHEQEVVLAGLIFHQPRHSPQLAKRNQAQSAPDTHNLHSSIKHQTSNHLYLPSITLLQGLALLGPGKMR